MGRRDRACCPKHTKATRVLALNPREQRGAGRSDSHQVPLRGMEPWSVPVAAMPAVHSSRDRFQFTVTLTGTEAMPLATTVSELAPVSVFAGTLNIVETIALPVATPILL